MYVHKHAATQQHLLGVRSKQKKKGLFPPTNCTDVCVAITNTYSNLAGETTSNTAEFLAHHITVSWVAAAVAEPPHLLSTGGKGFVFQGCVEGYLGVRFLPKLQSGVVYTASELAT